MELDINEIKRYLKYDNEKLDDVTKNNISKAIKLLDETALPKYVYSIYPITIEDDIICLTNTTLKFKSVDLARHLTNCDSIIVVAATLGLELDYLIKKLEITDIGLAYILNSVAVEYLEKYLDMLQEDELNIRKYMTSRYSIGYGDLDLHYQNDLIAILDATKKIGINVLNTHLMVPSKSVSAIIGLSDTVVSNNLKKCNNCLENGKCSGLCIGKEA